MNQSEALLLQYFLKEEANIETELEQTGGGVYAVIRKVEGGVESYVPLDECIGIHFYQGAAWVDGDEPTSYDEVYNTNDLV